VVAKHPPINIREAGTFARHSWPWLKRALPLSLFDKADREFSNDFLFWKKPLTLTLREGG